VELRYPLLSAVLVTGVASWRMQAYQTDHQAKPEPVTRAQDAPKSEMEREPTLRFTSQSMDIAAAARQLLEQPNRSFRNDCSGYISSVFTAAGIEMDGTVAELYAIAAQEELLHHHPIPRIGDLAFFDNTHDRNKNGAWDDPRTHIGVVVDVEPDGTAWIAHKARSYDLIPMNLMEISTKAAADGRLINGSLRRTGSNDQWSMYRAGQLWSGFATVDPDVAWLGPSGRKKRGR
jgi:hypothetical protein